MKKTKPLEKNFYLPKGERNGVLLFFFLSIAGILLIRYWSQSEEKIIVSISGNTIGVQAITKREFSSNQRYWNSKQKKNNIVKERQSFMFNPNSLPKDSLKLLGFSDRVTNNLLKFRDKGGKFKSISDLKKIYGMDSTLLKNLEPFTSFDIEKPKQMQKENSLEEADKISIYPTKPSKIGEIILVEINSADSAQLVDLKGIGPYYAKKIIQSRKILGGYANIDQIVECNVLPDSVFNKIRLHVTVDTTRMEKININQASYHVLIKHPYFDKNLVTILLNYRENHGLFTSLSQLKRIKVLDNTRYTKIIKHLRL
ncbi:MAG: helix-hairpin-helix domain-containing protein [Saprospiraceae bacterium]